MSTSYRVERPIEFSVINNFVQSWSNINFGNDEETNVINRVVVRNEDNSTDTLFLSLDQDENVNGFDRFGNNRVISLLLEFQSLSGVRIFDEYEDTDMLSLFPDHSRELPMTNIK